MDFISERHCDWDCVGSAQAFHQKLKQQGGVLSGIFKHFFAAFEDAYKSAVHVMGLSENV